MSIVAYITVYNEEYRINKCLSSFSWVDELVVFDKGSTDHTVMLAKQYTDHIYSVPYTDGSENFVQNISLHKTKAIWSFFIIASHLIDNSLACVIMDEITNYSSPYNVIELPLKMNILGIENCKSPYHVKYKSILIKTSNLKLSNVVHKEVGWKSYKPIKISKSYGYLHHITSPTPSILFNKTDRYNRVLANQLFKNYGKKSLNQSIKFFLFTIKTSLRNGYLWHSRKSFILALIYISEGISLLVHTWFINNKHK